MLTLLSLPRNALDTQGPPLPLLFMPKLLGGRYINGPMKLAEVDGMETRKIVQYKGIRRMFVYCQDQAPTKF